MWADERVGVVRQLVSQSIHKIVETKNPKTVITENLNIRGKAKSKKMSRLVSYWMRSALIERLNFLALAEGFRHKQVNPAYTSQMCPTCRCLFTRTTGEATYLSA